MKTISLYSGGGGIDQGLKKAGIKTTVAIDFEKDCCRTIKQNHPDCEVICGKVSDYIDSFSKVDCIVGGPPCQGFSIANMKKNLDPTEVNNFWKIVDKLKPKYYLMENVRDVVEVCFRKPVYLINCADYGIPQKRIRRIFTNIPLPKPTHSEKNWITVKKALNLEGLIENRRQLNDDKKRAIKRRYSTDQPTVTITVDTRLWSLTDPKFQNISFMARKYFHELNKPARTVTTKDLGIQPSMMLTDGYYARKLNIQELAILQGFPKSYKFYGTKTSVRKQIGNAVPPKLITEFFKQVT